MTKQLKETIHLTVDGDLDDTGEVIGTIELDLTDDGCIELTPSDEDGVTVVLNLGVVEAEALIAKLAVKVAQLRMR